MATEIYVSDIHGEYQGFKRILEQQEISFLHCLGDIYDRGPRPDLVMDELLQWPNMDIIWGNHDILWMGAALGQRGCIANVVRICARYSNLDILEDLYGINLDPLRKFAWEAYGDDPCIAFKPKGSGHLSPEALENTIKMQKAISFIQFKVEAQLINENPSFELDDRNLLHCIDYGAGTVDLNGIIYPLRDTVFPTLDPADPYTMTEGEAAVMDYLEQAFVNCSKLQEHVRLFLDKGSLYKIVDNKLLFHAAVPLNADGSLMETELYGTRYKGRALFDAVDSLVRAAYLETEPVARKQGLDMLWYLWLAPASPLFAKSKMATFELYLIEDKASQKEVKNPYYTLLEDSAVMDAILEDFGMDPANSHMISGHVPVKVKDGENPIKCSGKVLIIDGGMSAAYQSTTGIAGMAILEDEAGMRLVSYKIPQENDENESPILDVQTI